MKKKVLLLLTLLVVPIMLKAESQSNYENSKKYVNSYITSFTMYDRYIEYGKGVPYEFDGQNKVKSGFINGALINKKEIELSKIKNNSYLLTGATFFTMTEENNKIYNVNVNKLDLIAKTENSGTRVTELVKPTTKVIGEGTRTNPWVFVRKYRVVFSGNGSTEGRMEAISCDYNYNCNLPKNSFKRTGYTFAGWSLEPEGEVAYGDNTSPNITAVPNNDVVILYAIWKPNKYIVEFNGNGYTSGTTASVSCTYDEPCTLPSNGYTKTGYTFKGWATTNNGSAVYQNNAKVKNLTALNNAVVTFYAKWEPITYTIKFDKNSSEASGTVSSIVCTYDAACTLPSNNFTRVGATFNGWAVTSSSAVKYNNRASVKNLTATPNGTYTLYAHWNVNTYKISYNYNGGSAGSYNPSTAKYGEVITISNPSRSCYSFDGWRISNYDSSYAKYGNSSSSVTSSIGTYTSGKYFKNLTATNNATVTFTASWSYSCSSSRDDDYDYRPSGGGSGSSNRGNSGSSGSNCDTRCKMEKNSRDWHNADENTKKQLENDNKNLMKELPECCGGSCCDRKNDGTIKDSNGKCIYTGVGKTCS